MRRRLIPIFLFLILLLSGCDTVGSKTASQSVIYFSAALLSLILLIACLFLVHKNKRWFISLFSSVLVVNAGYFLLSVSPSLQFALWANRISYLGSVLLPLAMLMIISDVSGTRLPKWLRYILIILSTAIFLIAASPGILPIYYKEVTLNTVNGVSVLEKVYGPLHPLYLFYLLFYFIFMVAVIIRAKVKKTLDSTAHGVILAMSVLVNIGVWLIEQLTSIDFEMLSVSYIISELFLLGIHLVMNEYQKIKKIVRQVEEANYSAKNASEMLKNPTESISPENIEVFTSGLNSLTPTEKSIYDAHVLRLTTKEIMTSLNIKETTLKYHNGNLYGKLGVSSKKELLEMHKYLYSLKNAFEESDK